MNNATLAGIKRSNRELEAAVKKAFEVFGEPLQLSSSSSNGRDFRTYEVYANDSVWAKHATGVSVGVEALCEFGRPKNITPKMWVWESHFVSIKLSAHFPYNIYWHEFGSVSESGKHTKARLRPFAMSVTVEGGRNYGLGDWAKKRADLAGWAGKFENDTARARLFDGIAEADRQVAAWKQGMAEMAKSAEALL